jgi:glycosyltransferase involved in cell wall biosynthesis
VVVDRLACAALDAGHEVVLLAGGPVGTNRYPTVDIGGTFTQYVRAPLAARRWCRDADALIDVENGIPFMSPLWWRRPRVLLVHHVHTHQWRQHFGRAMTMIGRLLEEVVMPRAYRRTQVYAVSSSTRDQLVGIGFDAEHIEVIESGIDVPEVMIAESPDPMFLALGRLVPHKRLDLLLDVWTMVQPKVGGRLVIAGDGPERTRIEARITRDRLAGVEVLGFVDNATRSRLAGQAWLLVHTASHEGWGIVVLEAAAAGTPTIGFDVPGVRDAIVDGETGVLASDADAFAAAWVALAGDCARRRVMGDAARQRAAKFGWAATGERFLSLVERVAARR